MKRETFRRKSTRQLRSLFTPHVSRLILSRGSVGQIEYNTSDQRNNQACDEYGGKTQWRNVAVVKKGQKNGGDYGHSEAYYVTFQIDRFAWLTPHVRRALSVALDARLCFTKTCQDAPLGRAGRNGSP